MIGFIKYIRSDASLNLENRPNENHLLNVIARRTSRNGNPVKGVKVGESLLGDYENLGLKRQPYRTALANLIKWGYITTRVTNKTTYAKLANIEVYDCNVNGDNHDPNHDLNQQATNKQPTANQQLTTIKKERKKEVKKVKKKEVKDILEKISIPSQFDNDLLQAFRTFLQMRKEIKKPFKSATSLQTRIDTLGKDIERYGKEEVLKAINKSIEHEWQGIKVNWEKETTVKTIEESKPYTPPYTIPDFGGDKEKRHRYFFWRLTEYRMADMFNEGTWNTVYKPRIHKKEAEQLCYELEQQMPELLKIELPS